jgi:hypothetical protein
MDQQRLDRYWNGETSLEEEQEILKEMTGSTGPDTLYFRMIAEARKQRSTLKIEDIKSYNQQIAKPIPRTIVLPVYRWVASAAAVLLFAIASYGLWDYTHRQTQLDIMADSFDDPQKAYEEVREALAFVSGKLNKSQSEAMINIKKASTYAEMFK